MTTRTRPTNICPNCQRTVSIDLLRFAGDLFVIGCRLCLTDIAPPTTARTAARHIANQDAAQ